MLSTIERPASLCSAKPMALESTEAAYVSSASVLVGVTREDTMLTILSAVASMTALASAESDSSSVSASVAVMLLRVDSRVVT